MNFKRLVIFFALICFSTSLFARPAAYSFSSFGGGLPSSAKKITKTSSTTTTSQRIIIEEDDEEDDYEDDDDNSYDYNDEPTVRKSKSAALLATYVTIGVVAIAGIAFGSYYLASESGKCCETASTGLFEGCAEGCGEAIGEACAESMAEACAESCEESLGSMIVNGFNLMPVFIP